ncbi:MAG: TonB-dependent receptor [Saprospiraceae bacterium]|nr:TonB-dependent receptor [Saprospiraceae bacterium]
MQFTERLSIRIGKYQATIAMVLWSFALPGQSDSTLVLEEIEVTAQRINLTEIGKHTDDLDSQFLGMRQYNNLATVLAIQTPLYVRSYGSGTLATLGIRGGSASHTQLLWNGIPLRNPMLGMVDLALVPAFFTDEVAIHYGGHGAAFGSGAVGGLISLSNETLSTDDNLSLHLSAGSWDAMLGELKASYGLKKFRFSTRLFAQSAENNYRYRLAGGIPEKNQVHNELRNVGLMQEFMWSMHEREHLTARLWYQETDRQIPPTSTQTTSKSAQQDESLRMSLQWTRLGDKFKWQVKTAWLDENIDYQDSLILLFTQNQFRTWLVEAETTVRLAPGLNLAGGVYTEIVEAQSVNYEAGTSRHQHAAFASLGYLHVDWVWRFQMREELTDGAWSPLLVDLSAEWSGIRHITLKSSVSRNYRIPTLNDLYWRPGGNPELQPEEGWTLEAGIHYSGTSQNLVLTTSLTAFTRNIDQWIMWMPPTKDIRNYWSPINIAEVYSHGLEARGNMEITAMDWHFNFNAGLDLTWSKFGGPLPEFMIQEGDQLFYVPVENILAGIRIENAQWSGYYYHHWFGSSTGINEDVRAGNTGSASLNFNFLQRKLKWSLYLQADNVWNVPYRIIERRPMPGRSFMGGVRFLFL